MRVVTGFVRWIVCASFLVLGAAPSLEGQTAAVALPSPQPHEPAEREMRNYFGRGMSADSIVSMVLVCKDTVQKSGVMSSVQAHAYCVCAVDASRRNVGASPDFVVEKHAATKVQIARCLEFARAPDASNKTVTPYESDPFDSSNAVLIGEQLCERDEQIRERHLRYRMAYCACRADAMRAHGDRIYLLPSEKQFCDVVATHRVEAGSFPTVSQLKYLRVRLGLPAPMSVKR
jgi:hypothetical protein